MVTGRAQCVSAGQPILHGFERVADVDTPRDRVAEHQHVRAGVDHPVTVVLPAQLAQAQTLASCQAADLTRLDPAARSVRLSVRR